MILVLINLFIQDVMLKNKRQIITSPPFLYSTPEVKIDVKSYL